MGLLGKEKSESGVAEACTLSLVGQNIVQELYNYAEAVKQQIICAKQLMVV